VPDADQAAALGGAGPGAVTPLALTAGDACRHTGLLLDVGLKAGGKFAVGAGCGGASVVTDAAGLEAFLK
jgi:hypothetical protein